MQLALEQTGAVALTSLHNHPVRHVSGSREWSCDFCQKDCEMGRDARYRCGICQDFDACAACHHQPHAGPLAETHSLKLVSVDRSGKWFCNKCGTLGGALDAAGNAKPLRRFRCFECDDFDLCGGCVREHVHIGGMQIFVKTLAGKAITL
jgi:hypothetical protein